MEIYKQNLSPISFKALKPIEYLFGKVQSKNKSEIHAINLDECFKPEIKNVCIRTFIERYNKSFSSDKYKLKIADYDDSNNNGTVIVLQYGSKKAVFYASNYNMRSNASESTAVLEIAKGKANNKYEIYQAAKTPSGTLIIHNFLLKDAFGINEDNIYHIPGDEFLSTEDAFMMLKKYYSYDGKEGLYNDITGYAIYEYKNDEGKERYIYTFRTPYKSLLNQYFIGTESEKKAIRYYVITDILTSEQIEDIKKAYIYTGITLYYRNSDNEYSILKGNPKKPTFQNSTKELIKLLEGEPFLTPRMNDNGTITIGYGYDFTKEDDLET